MRKVAITIVSNELKYLLEAAFCSGVRAVDAARVMARPANTGKEWDQLFTQRLAEIQIETIDNLMKLK